MDKIPADKQYLLSDERRAFAYLATSMPDGTPQVTPVWFNTDGEHILINSARGRVKDKNMRARANVAIVIADPDDPYRYLQVRGKVVEITESGAREHIDSLSQKYTGRVRYSLNSPDEVRVTYKILPFRVSG